MFTSVRLILFSLALSLAAAPLIAQDAAADTESASPTLRADEQLGYPAAAVLGVVEGLTEYLPVSSTGHLIIANKFLGLDAETPVNDKQGRPLLAEEKPPLPARIWNKATGAAEETPVTVAFTLKNAADAYIIVIQFGAILAVLFAYWHRVSGLALGLLRGQRESFLLARNLLLAFLPAAVIGLLFNQLIEKMLFGIFPVILALFVGAFVMLGVEKLQRLRAAATPSEGPDLHQLGIAQSIAIGFAQCCAMWPGTSRSMAAICGGYLVGLSPVRATEFSFLLGLVTLSAASAYKTYSSGELMLAAFDFGPLLLGLALATVTAFFAVKWMVGWISRHGLALFAWYRLALAAVLAVIFYA